MNGALDALYHPILPSPRIKISYSNFMETYTNRHLHLGPTLDVKAGVDLQLMMGKIRLPIDLNAQR